MAWEDRTPFDAIEAQSQKGFMMINIEAFLG